jgi:hypothetical protein
VRCWSLALQQGATRKNILHGIFDRRATRLQRHTQGSPVATSAPESSGVNELEIRWQGSAGASPALFGAPAEKLPICVPRGA